jgi:hypothetical protein
MDERPITVDQDTKCHQPVDEYHLAQHPRHLFAGK